MERGLSDPLEDDLKSLLQFFASEKDGLPEGTSDDTCTVKAA